MLNLANIEFKSMHEQIQLETLMHLRKNITMHIPPQIGHFYLWLLNEKNPCFQRYTDVLGINKIVKTCGILNELLELDDERLQKLAYSYSGALGAYIAYEIMSDNLAIGLLSSKEGDDTFAIRKEVITKFNHAMQEKLTGSESSALDLLTPYASQINLIPCYEHHQFALEYKKYHPNVNTTVTELEHCVLFYLTLNIETCFSLIQLLKDHPLYSFLKESVLSRYTAVNRLLEVNQLTEAAILAGYGAETILTTPIMVFMIGVIDMISPNPMLRAVIIQGSLLSQSIQCASCIIRLLNDVGTLLLSSSEDEQEIFFKELIKLYKEQVASASLNRSKISLLAFLGNMDQRNFKPYLARIRKDIKQGEFNVCLDNVKDIENPLDSFEAFFENIRYYSKLYQEKLKTLTMLIDKINAQTQDERISKIILNMVEFHRKHYAQNIGYKFNIV